MKKYTNVKLKNAPPFLNREKAMFLMIAVCITVSTAPLLFRSIESADVWQIIFYRSISWITALIFILIYKYRLSVFKKIKAIGIWGLFAGFLLAGAQISFIQAMSHITIANTVFVLSAIPFVTALIAYIFLREKIKRSTIIMMIFALIGIFIMVNEGIKSGNAFGNFMAILTLLCMSSFPVILRKNRHIDMIPTLLVPALIIGLVGFLVKGGDLAVSQNDLTLSFIWGGVLNGVAHSIFIIATRHLLAAEITFFMLLEFTLGPLWVWGFIGEVPSNSTLFGGIFVMSSIAILTIIELVSKKNIDQNIEQINSNDTLVYKETDHLNLKNVMEDEPMEEEKKSEIEIIKSDDKTKALIKSEIEKILLSDMSKWMDNNLKEIIEESAKEHLIVKKQK